MFKNLMLYRTTPFEFDKQAIEEMLEKNKFLPCQPSQAYAVGWVPPRGFDNGELAECIHGQLMLTLVIEEKTVPPDVVKRALKAACEEIEKETGRCPGYKYRKELKQQVYEKLLPLAFPRQKSIKVWLNPKSNLLLIDASSHTQAGIVIKHLIQTFEGLAIADARTETSPCVAMTDWLLNGDPEHFSVDMDCRLKSDNELKTQISYSRRNLDKSVQDYIREGMYPALLAMTWKDRVSFALTEDGAIKRIQLRSVVFENLQGNEEDAYEADVMIATGELLAMLADLFAVLGGVQEMKYPLIDGIKDELYEKAAQLVTENQKASISYIQRYFNIAYYRAACLLEQMQEAGIISPPDDKGQRKVLHENRRAIPA